ncbi:MAG: hypothetical protein QOG53_1776 [Frankiales bacterium]|jgi:hypothetical protein|nr:hypothetical protein [Frankiales bacterium]
MTRRRLVVLGTSATAALVAVVLILVWVWPSNGHPARLTVGGATEVSAAPTPGIDATPSPDVSEPSPSAEPAPTSAPTGVDPTDARSASPNTSRDCVNESWNDVCPDGKPGWSDTDGACHTNWSDLQNVPPANDLRLSLVMDSATLVTATYVAGTMTMQNEGVNPARFFYIRGLSEGDYFQNAGLVDSHGEGVTALNQWATYETEQSVTLGPGQSESFRVQFKVVTCSDTPGNEQPAIPPGSYGAVARVMWYVGTPGEDSYRDGQWISDPVPVTVTG